MRSSPDFEMAGLAWYSELVRSCLTVVGVVMVGEEGAPRIEPGAVDGLGLDFGESLGEFSHFALVVRPAIEVAGAAAFNGENGGIAED